MQIISGVFQLLDQKDCFRIQLSGNLVGDAASALRQTIEQCLQSSFDLIYVDVKEVNDIDLSGTNELIHSHYTLAKAGKKMLLVYKKQSSAEKWIATTGLDKFVATAIIPA